MGWSCGKKRADKQTEFCHFQPVGALVRFVDTHVLYIAKILTAPDTFGVSCYLATNEWVTHGESAAMTASGDAGVLYWGNNNVIHPHISL